MKGNLSVLDDCDMIFAGFPIWWSDMLMAVYTFLEEILKEYPQIEVVQVQFHYVDYDDRAVEFE